MVTSHRARLGLAHCCEVTCPFLHQTRGAPRAGIISGQALAWRFCENPLQAKIPGCTWPVRHVHARQPLGEIPFREAKSTGTCVSWKAPGGLVSGNHGDLWAWPGPYPSSPPRASPEPLVTGAAGGVLGGGEPRASWRAACFSRRFCFCGRSPIQAGSLRCPGSGWVRPRLFL